MAISVAEQANAPTINLQQADKKRHTEEAGSSLPPAASKGDIAGSRGGAKAFGTQRTAALSRFGENPSMGRVANVSRNQ